VVAQQTGERFSRVMRPKVRGAWNLHEITKELDLDFFVLFSAGAGLFGARGQSNYAAANTFLDALAHHRRLRGLPALSVNWGAWKGGGMAAGVDARQRARWADHGIGLIDPETGLAMLRALLDSGVAQAAVLPIEWARFGAAQGGRVPPLISTLVQQVSHRAHGTPGTRDDAAPFSRQLQSVAPGERFQVLAGHVTDQIAAVLGRSSVSLPDDRGFAELGMDSLMSVEVSNRLKRSLELPIPATVAFEHPTIATLTAYLGNLLGLDADRPPAGPPREAEPTSGLLRDIARLSEDEAERTLADELEQAGY
jgi:acyl carrier protein